MMWNRAVSCSPVKGGQNSRFAPQAWSRPMYGKCTGILFSWTPMVRPTSWKGKTAQAWVVGISGIYVRLFPPWRRFQRREVPWNKGSREFWGLPPQDWPSTWHADRRASKSSSGRSTVKYSHGQTTLKKRKEKKSQNERPTFEKGKRRWGQRTCVTTWQTSVCFAQPDGP